MQVLDIDTETARRASSHLVRIRALLAADREIPLLDLIIQPETWGSIHIYIYRPDLADAHEWAVRVERILRHAGYETILPEPGVAQIVRLVNVYPSVP